MEKTQEESYKEVAAKAKEAFSSGDYTNAIKYFTDAIALEPKNHLLFSNRSACYANLKQYSEAFTDAQKCIELKPDFARGYGRKGLAEYYLEKYEDAVRSYEAGLNLDPNNAQLKEGYTDAKKAAEANLFGSQKEVMDKLMADRIVKEYFKDPNFVAQLQQTQVNPSMLFSLMKTDPRFLRVFHIMSGIPMEEIIAANQKSEGVAEQQKRKEEETAKMREEQQKERVRKEAEMKMTAEQLQESKNKQLAENEKLKGNDAYKNKKLDEALEYYNKAISLYAKEPLFYLNKAAVFMEQKKFEESVKACDESLNLAESMSPRSLDKIAKAYARKGNALVQMKKFKEAIEMFEKSLIEVSDPNVKESKKKCIEAMKMAEEQAYINPELADQHKEKGNKFFKDGNYTEAMKEYNEAIKRNPSSAVFYVNRALTYLKLIEYNRALEDLDKAIKLDPKYIKAYDKKGIIHNLTKEYHKALDDYDEGLAVDPTNKECIEGRQRTQEAAYSTPPSEDRAKRAMDDPKVRIIMQDPRIIQLMKEMRENPMGTKPSLTDPFITKAVERLIAAGILGMR